MRADKCLNGYRFYSIRETSMKVKALVLAGLALPLFAATAVAHHSFAMFDPEKMITKEGTVKEFEWTNPHVWLHIMSTDETGKAYEWSFEMQAVVTAASAGWRADTVKPGDKVTVEFHPLKDGSRGGELVAATVPDGRRLGSSATRPAPARQ
jgi:uncharacterized protein DUF6152